MSCHGRLYHADAAISTGQAPEISLLLIRPNGNVGIVPVYDLLPRLALTGQQLSSVLAHAHAVGYAAEEGMGYRDILKHYYSGVSIRTVGSGTSSGGGLFGWLRRLLGM